ncbi:MAG: hypothetical protein CLLPBCKN_002587 [Chroococcidiopsis cubana SAG 39.79]|nr:hypothetical protein [Chroococcidiopsis cubana SAG 39.79]
MSDVENANCSHFIILNNSEKNTVRITTFTVDKLTNFLTKIMMLFEIFVEMHYLLIPLPH